MALRFSANATSLLGRRVVFRLSPARSGFFTAAGLLIDRCPSPSFGLFMADTTVFVAFFDMFGFALLLISVAGFVTSRHSLSRFTNLLIRPRVGGRDFASSGFVSSFDTPNCQNGKASGLYPQLSAQVEPDQDVAFHQTRPNSLLTAIIFFGRLPEYFPAEPIHPWLYARSRPFCSVPSLVPADHPRRPEFGSSRSRPHGSWATIGFRS